MSYNRVSIVVKRVCDASPIVCDASPIVRYVNPIVGYSCLTVRHARPTEENLYSDQSNTDGLARELL